MATLNFSTPTWIDTVISGKIKSAIQDKINATNEGIAEANRRSSEHIADLDRKAREEIAALDRESRENISQLDRESREKVAEMEAAAGITSSVIRIVPPLLINSGGNSNQSSNNNSPLNINTRPQTSAAEARSKADALFPTLEPTFKFSPIFHEVEVSTVPTSESNKVASFKKPYLSPISERSNVAKWLAIPAIGLAMGAGSKVAFKQFQEDYSFGGIK